MINVVLSFLAMCSGEGGLRAIVCRVQKDQEPGTCGPRTAIAWNVFPIPQISKITM